MFFTLKEDVFYQHTGAYTTAGVATRNHGNPVSEVNQWQVTKLDCDTDCWGVGLNRSLL